MGLLVILLFILAVILCALRGFGIAHPRLHLGWLGAAAGLLALLLANWHGVGV